ncbi:MAG: CPBP family intramembrane glutamic endopeptidase [Candidatus Undinarchaeales archaeon]
MSVLIEFLSRENPIELAGYTVDVWPFELGIILGFASFLMMIFLFSRAYSPLASGKLTGFFGSVFVIPAIEELIFRLVMITLLIYAFGSPWIAILISAFLFATAHIPSGGGFKFIGTFLMSLLYGFVFVEFGIISPIIGHMTHNFLSGVSG